MLTWWLFYIYIACALLYIDFCYHACLHLFAYVVFICFVWLCVAWLPFFLYDAYLAIMFICDIDMLTTSIDSLVCFNIRLFLLYDYLALLNMYILIFVYLIHIGMIDSLYCILSYLSQHIVYSCYIPILLIIFLPGLCVDMSDIPVICMTTWCMIAILLCDACITCLCGTHIYPLSSNSLVSVDLVSIDFVFDMRLVTLFALRPS